MKDARKWTYFASTCVRKMLCVGAIKSNGVILESVVRQLNTTNVLVAWAFALQHGVAYMIAPFCLLFFNVFSDRQLCIIGGILSGFGYIFCGFLLNSVWELFIGFSISGFGLGLASFSSTVALQQYFESEQLSKLLSILLLFDFVGVAIVPPVLQLFLSQYGLRNSLLLFGALVWNTVLCGVVARRPYKDKRESKGENQKEGEKQQELESKQKQGETKSHNFFKKGFIYVCNIFQHKHLGKLIIVEFIGAFIFVSWALYLVSLGITLGLSDTQAVFLSTAGGIGGFCGRIITACLFQLDMVNPLTSIMIPFFITGTSFVVVVFMKDFYVIMFLVLLSGVGQGVNSSAMISLTPTIVCSYYYRHALSVEYFAEGFAIQFSGLFSGLIHDVTGSTVYIFLIYAVLCYTIMPIAIWWKCHGKASMECQHTIHH